MSRICSYPACISCCECRPMTMRIVYRRRIDSIGTDQKTKKGKGTKRRTVRLTTKPSSRPRIKAQVVVYTTPRKHGTTLASSPLPLPLLTYILVVTSCVPGFVFRSLPGCCIRRWRVVCCLLCVGLLLWLRSLHVKGLLVHLTFICIESRDENLKYCLP